MGIVTGSVAGGAWNTNGAWLLGAQPTAADDVILHAASGAISIPTGTTAVCRSLDCTGFASSLTFATTTSVLSIGDASGGKCLFVNTMTLPLTGIGTINFLGSTAATTYALTTAGLVMPNLTVNSGASTTIQFADAVTATGATVKLTAGLIDFNSKAVTCGTWTYTAGTVTTGTQTLTCSGAGITFAGGGQSYSSVVLSGSGTATVSGANTFVNLTRTGTAVKTDALTCSSAQTISTTLTLSGQSVTNRLLVQSNTVGTPRTITAAAIVLTNCDFMDITGAGLAANAAWTGTSMGDCQGNSNITFDTPATQTYTDTGSHSDNWSTLARWTSRVPLPQDNVLVPLGSTGTLTADMPRLGKTVDFTGYTGTFTVNVSAGVTWFGNVTLATGMTVTTGTGGYVFNTRTAATITSNGKAFANFVAFGGTGTITLADAFNCSLTSVTINMPGGTLTTSSAFVSTGLVTLSTGTFTVVGAPGVTVPSFASGTGNTRVLNMGSGTWTVTGTSGTPWSVNSTGFGLTVNAQGSTILLSAASASTRTFAGGGQTYGTLTYTVAGSTGQLTITGSNTFGTINFSDATNARTLQFTSGTTNIIRTPNITGTNTKNMTVSAVTPATPAFLCLPDLNIGTHSTLVSGDVNLIVGASSTTMDYISAQDIVGYGIPTLASGTGAASNPVATLQLNAGQGTGTGTASNPTGALQPAAGNAAGTGTGYGISGQLIGPVGSASGTGIAYGLAALLVITAGNATGTGTAFTTAAAMLTQALEAFGVGLAYNTTTIDVEPGLPGLPGLVSPTEKTGLDTPASRTARTAPAATTSRTSPSGLTGLVSPTEKATRG